MKAKPKLNILYEYQLNIYLTVDSVVKYSQKMDKIDHISVRDIQTIDFVKYNTTIELNRVSIFFMKFQNQVFEWNFELGVYKNLAVKF